MGLHTSEELQDVGEVIDVTPNKKVQDEIDQHANQEPIDITPDPASNHAEKEEAPPQDIPGSDGMTEAEKAEILAQEQAEAEAAQTDGPDW